MAAVGTIGVYSTNLHNLWSKVDFDQNAFFRCSLYAFVKGCLYGLSWPMIPYYIMTYHDILGKDIKVQVDDKEQIMTISDGAACTKFS
jgi:hypothetical protein